MSKVQVRADIEALKEHGANELAFPAAIHPPRSSAKRKASSSSGRRSSKAASNGSTAASASNGNGSSGSSGPDSSSAATAVAAVAAGEDSSSESDGEGEGGSDLVTLKAMQWAAATLLSRSFYLTLPIPGASSAPVSHRVFAAGFAHTHLLC